MTKFIRVDSYSDENDVPKSPDKAIKRYIQIFDDTGLIETFTEISEEGFKLPKDDISSIGKDSDRMYEDGIGAPPSLKNEDVIVDEDEENEKDP